MTATRRRRNRWLPAGIRGGADPRDADRAFQRRGMVRLDDGTVGYAMAPDRTDDCLRAAVATVLQVPPEEVPDPRLRSRVDAGHDIDAINAQSWAQLERWLDGRGLRLVFHETVPTDQARWVGVCPAPPTGRLAAQLNAVLPRRERRALKRSGYDTARHEHFADHCLVMARDRVLFDPAVTLVAPMGLTLREWQATDVAWGLSFDRSQGDTRE